MAFTITPNQRPAETPALEHSPMPTPESTGAFAVESPATPEVREASPEEQHAASDAAAAETLRTTLAVPVAVKQEVQATEKSEVEVKIDKILEADLKDIFRDLPEKIRPEFKKRGEKAARALKRLIESAKATAIAIANILREWLRLIPASGAYFAEQLVKIKTDQLMALANTLKHALV
jgi:hypothetical protein